MTLPPICHVVTAHDTSSKAVISSQGPLPFVKSLDALPDREVFQRGTSHAWANHSGKPCPTLAVLIGDKSDAKFGNTLDGH